MGSIILFIVLFLSFPAKAQEEGTIVFSGVVFDAQTKKAMPQVNCRKPDMLITTDDFGRFVLKVRIGDTVTFSHVGYRRFDIVVPDSLDRNEYIVAVALPADTMQLAEVVVVRRFREKEKMMATNIRNNISGSVNDAFRPTQEMTVKDNQRRILDEYAASTNKGHVPVVGVGMGSFDAYDMLRITKKKREQEVRMLSVEEIDLVKMLLHSK